MNSNFIFLKKIDKNLYDIALDAEKLYRDEYFEQCMTQTRRFGENVCKNVLGSKRTLENNFDQMLATLKDCITGEEQEKEFIDDLYFLKKHGNQSTHASFVKKDGMEALECLQRAFEVAINYCVYHKNAEKQILKLRYDTELLVTGEKTKKTLAERYKEEKARTNRNNKPKQKQKLKQNQNYNSQKEKQSHKMVTQKNKSGVSAFWYFVGFSLIISFIILILINILTIS